MEMDDGPGDSLSSMMAMRHPVRMYVLELLSDQKCCICNLNQPFWLESCHN